MKKLLALLLFVGLPLSAQTSGSCTKQATGSHACTIRPDTVRVADTTALRVVRDSLGSILAYRDAVIVALKDTIATLRAPAPTPVPTPTPVPPPAPEPQPSPLIPELPSGYNLRLTWSGSPAPPSGWPTGWAGSPAGSVSVVSDPTAPVSPSAVARINYPSGFRSGDEPQTWEYGGTSGAQAVVITYWYKYSAGFEGEPSSVNKHVFLFASDGSVIGVSLLRFTGNSSTGFLDWVFEGGTTGSMQNQRLASNQMQVRKDTWHRVTIEVNGATTRLWHDGVLVGSTSSAAHKTIGSIKIAPTWGGNTGARMSSAGQLFFDELQVRTK